MRREKPKNSAPMNTKSKKAFHMEFKNTAQKIAWSQFEQNDILFLLGPAGVGKAQTLDSDVYTPDGAKKMVDIKLGDVVCTPDGNTALVNGIFPQGMKEVYKISFDDGSSCECCKEHLWKVSHNVNGWKNRVVDTEFIINNYRNKNGRNVLKIPMTKPVCFKKANLLIEPYLMGALLGDGGLSGGNISFTTADEELVSSFATGLNDGYQLKQSKSSSMGYRLIKKERNAKANYYKEALKHYGLYTKKSSDKFIPSEYLYSSVQQRIALLQGLLDTDGTIGKKNTSYCFYTTSNKLMKDYVFLVNSLGGVCYVRTKKSYYKKNDIKIHCQDCYICTTALPNNINPFSLKRKQARWKPRIKYVPRRIITNVSLVGKKECQCILIDHPDHLYLTNNFIVTHNSHLAMAFAISEILSKKKRKIILTRPIVEAGEHLGFLPGSFSEKVLPHMMCLYDVMDTLVGVDTSERERINSAIEIAPIAYLRGRTFSNSICILDEAQNCTKAQIILFLTRLGEDSKVIITGDPTQSDLHGTSYINEAVTKLESVPGIGIMQFTEEQIVRHPLVSKILENLK